MVDAERELRKRDLRLRIARLRRRIDGRMRSSRREARRLLSWRAYVKSYPGNTIMAAFGVGLALSAGLSARWLARSLGLRLIRRAADQAGRLFWQDLQRVWADSSGEEGGVADGVASHNAKTGGVASRNARTTGSDDD